MAKLQLSKIGRPAKGRSVMKINRPLVRRAVKPLDKTTIFPGELAVPQPDESGTGPEPVLP